MLSSEVYERAFAKVASGVDPSLLPEDERTAVLRAKELTGTPGPGYPMPQRADPTRNRAE
ncbi:MAG: hypothetical protein M3313_05640 [Actinomycetota bacterium]|nr:hypothetical protein [Actinomycetota bacterium]